MSLRAPSVDASVPLGCRVTALLAGGICHGSFAVAVLVMAINLYTGMQFGLGLGEGSGALAWNLLIVAQFPVLHSWLLGSAGRRLLRRAVPHQMGAVLDTTLYATAASLQVIVVFGLWAPMGGGELRIGGWWGVLATLLYVISWGLLLRAMIEAGLGVQVGSTGWKALYRGEAPEYPGGFSARGLHGLCRHPIYGAFVLILWVGPVWTVDRLVLVLPFTFYCLWAPRRKEQRDLFRYGDTYRAYMNRTPRFIPRLPTAMRQVSVTIRHDPPPPDPR